MKPAVSSGDMVHILVNRPCALYFDRRAHPRNGAFLSLDQQHRQRRLGSTNDLRSVGYVPGNSRGAKQHAKTGENNIVAIAVLDGLRNRDRYIASSELARRSFVSLV